MKTDSIQGDPTNISAEKEALESGLTCRMMSAFVETIGCTMAWGHSRSEQMAETRDSLLAMAVLSRMWARLILLRRLMQIARDGPCRSATILSSPEHICVCRSWSNLAWVSQQCCHFSRNVVLVTPKIIYFYYQENIFIWSKYPKNMIWCCFTGQQWAKFQNEIKY